MIFETRRLIIRELCETDEQGVFDYASDMSVTKYVLWGTHSKLSDSREYIKSVMYSAAEEPRSEYSFAVTLKDGTFIGSVGFTVKNRETGEADIGWTLIRRYWSSGYATEAATALMDFAFNNLGIHRFTATCDADNPRSAHVMERLGMRQEGRGVKCRWYRQEACWHDQLNYAILREEWRNKREAAGSDD